MFLTHRFTASLQARLLRTAVTGLSIISIGAIAPSPVLSGAAKPDQALQQAAKTGSMPRPNAAITQARAVLEDAHLKANAWVDEGDGAETQEVVEEIKRGDTLNVVLARAGVPAPQAAEAVSALRKVYNPRDLKPGQQVRLVLANAPTPGTPDQMVKLHLQPSVERDVMVEASAAGAFEAREVVKPLKVELTRGGGTIDLSLFQTGINNGVPVDVMLEMIRTFSYDVDFQRDIQPGDGFDILYEQKVTEDGKVARVGHMLYASMSLSGQVLKLYRYEDGSGFVDFYTPKGESVRKALLKTPIDGAKLTSGCVGIRSWASPSCIKASTSARRPARRSWRRAMGWSPRRDRTAPMAITSRSATTPSMPPPMPIWTALPAACAKARGCARVR